MRTIWILTLTVCSRMLILVTANDGETPSFDEFASKFGKKYVGAARSAAKVNYEASVKKIQALNSRAAANNHNTKFVVNKFSALSSEEFQKKNMGLNRPLSAKPKATKKTTTKKTTTKNTTKKTKTTNSPPESFGNIKKTILK